MLQCPNPACPFRLRHGFAAEFEAQVERCRSCGGALEASAGRASGAALAGGVFGRLGVTLVLGAALAGFAGVDVPGLGGSEGLAPWVEAAPVDFSQFSLQLGLSWLMLGAVFVELGALVLPGGRAWRERVDGRRRLRGLALLVAMLGVILQSWVFGEAQTMSSLLIRCAGLPLLIGVAAANQRWGLGHGISLVVGALLVEGLGGTLLVSEDWVRELVVLLVLIGGAAVWIGRPARASARGRTPLIRDDEQARELGLGLTIPTCGVVPIELIGVVGLAFYALGQVAQVGELRGLVLGVELGLVLGASVALAYVFTRPALLVERWGRAFPRANLDALAGEALALFRRGLVRSGLLIVALLLLVRAELPAVEAVILAAIVLDLQLELRLRLREGEVVAVSTHLDVPGAEALALALQLEGVPAELQGKHHRALYHLFGWWLPTHVLVRPDDQDAAEGLRGQLLI